MKKTTIQKIRTSIYPDSMEEFFLQRRIHYIDDFAGRHQREMWIQRLYDDQERR